MTAKSTPPAWRDEIETSGIPGIASFTRERVERVMAISVAIAFLALGVQAFVAALSAEDVRDEWDLPLMLAVFVPFAAMELAFFTGRFVTSTGRIFVVAYIAALLAWPWATAGSSTPITYQPWIYFLVTVATVSGVIVLPMALYIALTVLIPLLYGLVRLIELGFADDAWIAVSLDTSFSLILGSVLLTLAWTFRTAASNIDERRVRAVSSYAQAAAVNATERERVAVAALMHDSVLAALIAAERANTPRENDLAVSMAREALTRLANTDRDVGEGSDAPLPATAIVTGIESTIAETRSDVELRVELDPETPQVPGRVARALVLAAAQAISNAVEHADAAGLVVSVRGTSMPGRVVIVVSDTGPGFAVDEVPADRLGIRASILARVSAFGGRAEVVSTGAGTRVSIEWQAGDA